MDELIVKLAFFAVIAFILGLGLLAVSAAWRRALREGGRLRLAEMMHRHGLDLAGAMMHAPSYDLAQATRRCVGCARKVECDRWLASGKRGGYEAFCPNAALIERLKPAGELAA